MKKKRRTKNDRGYCDLYDDLRHDSAFGTDRELEMIEQKRIELIRDVADWRFRETNDHWWLKVAVMMARKLNEGNYYNKCSRRGMMEELK